MTQSLTTLASNKASLKHLVVARKIRRENRKLVYRSLWELWCPLELSSSTSLKPWIDPCGCEFGLTQFILSLAHNRLSLTPYLFHQHLASPSKFHHRPGQCFDRNSDTLKAPLALVCVSKTADNSCQLAATSETEVWWWRTAFHSARALKGTRWEIGLGRGLSSWLSTEAPSISGRCSGRRCGMVFIPSRLFCTASAKACRSNKSSA
jgi:hypothetical protein